jgi:hypothetical protein
MLLSIMTHCIMTLSIDIVNTTPICTVLFSIMTLIVTTLAVMASNATVRKV